MSAATTTRATLVCSIDLPGTLGDSEPISTPWLRELGQELAMCEAPVTLTLAETALASQVRSVTTECHELALRVTANWAGPEVRRQVFARTLKSQLETAQAAGVVIRTLAWGDFPLTPHTDLLVKYGIQAIRTLPTAPRVTRVPRLFRGGATPAQRSEMVRFGVCTVPAVAVWKSGQNVRSLRKPLLTAAEQGVAHLACDFQAANTSQPLDGRFRQALRELMRHRHTVRARLETVAEFAERRMTGQKSMPAQSILRVA